MDIKVEDLKELKEKLDSLDKDDVLYISEDNKRTHVVIPFDMYSEYQEMLNFFNHVLTIENNMQSQKEEDLDLTYEEYEQIKQQVMEALEETLLPKPEKLN